MEIAGAQVGKQGGTQFGADLPVVAEGVEVTGRDAAVEVGTDVLDVLGLLGVDVAGEVEVVVVFLDLGVGDEAGIAGVLLGVGEHIDDLVQVAFAEAVFGAVLHKALGGVDHEDGLAGGGVLLVEDEDAGGDAGAVKEIGGQADDAANDAALDEVFADHALSVAPEKDAVGEDARALAGAFERTGRGSFC